MGGLVISLGGVPNECVKCVHGATGRMEAAEHSHSPLARGARHRLSLAPIPSEAEGLLLRALVIIGRETERALAMEHSVSDVIPGEPRR
eukprot:6466408-Amphidinium_carterae.1